MLVYEKRWEYNFGLVTMYFSYTMAVLAFIVAIFDFFKGEISLGFLLLGLTLLNLYFGYQGTLETRDYRRRNPNG